MSSWSIPYRPSYLQLGLSINHSLINTTMKIFSGTKMKASLARYRLGLFVFFFSFFATNLIAQDISTATFVQSVDLFSEITTPSGITYNNDGTKLFIGGTDASTAKVVYTYDLTTAYDISTATRNVAETFTVETAAFEIAATDLVFTPDGSRLFMVGNYVDLVTFAFADSLYSFDLSTNFDVSSIVLANRVRLDISGEEDFTSGIELNDDGSKIYLIGKTNDNVIAYNLSTAYDITSATLGNTFSVGAQMSFPESMRFSADGTRLFIAETNLMASTSNVYTYSLRTPYDISGTSISYTGGTEDLDPGFSNIRIRSMTFNPAGTKLYLAGTDNTGAPIREYDLASDLTAPNVNVTSTAASPTNISPIPFTVTFDKDVQNFVIGDITVTNGSADNFDNTNTPVFTIDVTPSGDADVTVEVAAAVAQDLAGNDNVASNSLTITYDTTSPGVSIMSSTAGPTNASPIEVDIIFDEPVTGFELSDIQIGNGTTSVLNTASSNVYSIDVVPDGDGEVTVDIAANVAEDLAGNSNNAAMQFSIDSDRTAPEPKIRDENLEELVSVNGTFTSAIVFNEDATSENVTGFELSDIVVTNGTASDFQQTDVFGTTIYAVLITPDATLADGSDITITIPASSAIDAAGNSNIEGTVTVSYDIGAPSLTIDPLSTNDNTPELTGTIDDDDATITVTVDGQELTANNGMDGGWTLADDELTALTDGIYDVVVTATDLAGNIGTDTSTGGLIIDTQAPVVTVNTLTTNVLSPELSGDIDDTNASISVAINSNSYNATNNGNGTWTLAEGAISPDLTDAIYEVGVVAMDAVGNLGMDQTNDELTVDTTSPVFTSATSSTIDENISEAYTAEATDASDLSYSLGSTGDEDLFAIDQASGEVTFNTAPDAETPADANGDNDYVITVIAGDGLNADTEQEVTITVSNISDEDPIFTSEPVLSVDENAAYTYSVEVSDPDGDAVTVTATTIPSWLTFSANVLSGTAEVAAGDYDVLLTAVDDGNGGTATQSFTIAVNDITPPTVEIQGAPSTASDAFTITIAFNEDVTGFEVGDISVANGSAGSFQMVDAATYSAEISPVASLDDGSEIAINIEEGTATDVAGNENIAATEVIVIYDRPYSGGSGTEADPYLIASEADLRELSASTEHLGAHFLQTADIKLEAVFGIIGGSQGFSGRYDGDHHIIDGYKTNDYVHVGDGFFSGLFSFIQNDSEIKNLGLTNVEISSQGKFTYFLGPLAGDNLGFIENCFATGSIVLQEGTAGGLTGRNKGRIMSSYSDVSVKADRFAGGLVGWNLAHISNSYATGSMEAVGTAGGLVGVHGTSNAIISNSYAIGSVNALTAGGLTGGPNTTVNSSFWDVETSGVTRNLGGTGLTTAQMKSVFTYMLEGWDFACFDQDGTGDFWSPDINGINEGYPVLAWQNEGDCQLVTGSEELIPSPKVYPSTTTGFVTIEAPDQGWINRIEVMDIMGKRVKSLETSTHQTRLNLSGERDGIYLIKVYQGQLTSTHRIILKK